MSSRRARLGHKEEYEHVSACIRRTRASWAVSWRTSSMSPITKHHILIAGHAPVSLCQSEQLDGDLTKMQLNKATRAKLDKSLGP